MGVGKIQIGIGVMWAALAALWTVLMFARLLAGDEHHHQMIMALVSSGLSTQSFNQAAVMAKLGDRR